MLVLLNRGGIRNPLPYAILGILLWLAVHDSGVHATIAGILLASTIPARAAHSPAHFEQRIEALDSAFRADRRDRKTSEDPLSNERLASIAQAVEDSAAAVQSPQQRMQNLLTPWVTFVIIPLFALANAGIDLLQVNWGPALGNPTTLGVVCGLVGGKFVGISLFSWIAVRAGWARLPGGVTWIHLTGAAWLAGIGFTMSLFISQLAFGDSVAAEQAKLGILLGSAIAASLGLVWLLIGTRSTVRAADRPDRRA